MKKSTKRLLILGGVLLLAVAWAWRYVSLNTYWKSTIPENYTHTVYSMGETIAFEKDNIQFGVQADGYAMRVDGFEVVDYDNYLVENEITLEYKPYVKPDKLALVYVTLFNIDSEAEGVCLVDFPLYGIDMYFSADWELLAALNPALQDGIGTALHPGQEYRFILVYDIYQELLNDGTWNHFEDYDLYFRLTAYPATREVKVQ